MEMAAFRRPADSLSLRVGERHLAANFDPREEGDAGAAVGVGGQGRANTASGSTSHRTNLSIRGECAPVRLTSFWTREFGVSSDIFPALALLLLASAPPSPVDTDREGVLVTTDRCPTANETINGFADADGCPGEFPADLRSVPGPIPGLRFILQGKQAFLLMGIPGRLEHVRHVLTRYPALRIQVVARERNSDLARQKAEEVRQQLVAYRNILPEISIHATRSSATPSIELTIAAGPDSDADGFADDFDVCPTAAGDGVSPCPGPDPDADDLAAPQDRCPTLPETHNGYQDTDGCPDAWPADITQLHGILAGVTYTRAVFEATEGPVDGRFLVQRGGLGYAARVTILLEQDPARPYVEVACEGAGWIRHGLPEDVGPLGYDAWKAGARAGVAYALRSAGLEHCGVRVTRIVGMCSDTNPTIVAAAAARAVWTAAGVTPDPAMLARVATQMFVSWERDATALPEFER